MSEEKHEIVEGIKYTYAAEWTRSLESRDHWLLYHYQQQLMENKVKPGDKVLEIGPGSGFCSNYLKSNGVQVTTLDIDEDKEADIHANIVTYQFEKSYDHVLAFEVFEHIPYEKFIQVLEKLHDRCRNIFMSVPENKRRLLDLDLWLPIIKNVRISVYVPKVPITETHHFWEVGHKNFTERRLETNIQDSGFEIEEKSKYKGRIYFILSS